MLYFSNWLAINMTLIFSLGLLQDQKNLIFLTVLIDLAREVRKGSLGTGMSLTRKPMGHEIDAMIIQANHCCQFNLTVSANFFKNSTITT